MGMDSIIHKFDRMMAPCASPRALRYSYFVREALLEPILRESLPIGRRGRLKAQCRRLAQACSNGAPDTELYSQTREVLYELLRPIPDRHRLSPERRCRRQAEAVRRFRAFDAIFSESLRGDLPERCLEERAAAREELRLLEAALEDAFSAQYAKSMDAALEIREKNAREAVSLAGGAEQTEKILLENRCRRGFLREESEKFSEILEPQRRNHHTNGLDIYPSIKQEGTENFLKEVQQGSGETPKMTV